MLMFAYISDIAQKKKDQVSAYGLTLAQFGLSFTISTMVERGYLLYIKGGYLDLVEGEQVMIHLLGQQWAFTVSLVLVIIVLLCIFFALLESAPPTSMRTNNNN